jgi:hypothetical protein
MHNWYLHPPVLVILRLLGDELMMTLSLSTLPLKSFKMLLFTCGNILKTKVFYLFKILILVWYNNQLTLLSPFQCTCNQCFKNLYIHVLMFLIWVGYILGLNIFLIHTKLSNFVFDPTKKMTYFFFYENFYEKNKISQVLKFKDNFSRIKNKSLIVLFYDPIIFQKF